MFVRALNRCFFSSIYGNSSQTSKEKPLSYIGGKNHNCYRHHINISTCACVGERWKKKKMFPAGLAGYSDTKIARAQRQTVKDEDVLFLKQHVQICAQSEGRHREREAYVTEG